MHINLQWDPQIFVGLISYLGVVHIAANDDAAAVLVLLAVPDAGLPVQADAPLGPDASWRSAAVEGFPGLFEVRREVGLEVRFSTG